MRFKRPIIRLGIVCICLCAGVTRAANLQLTNVTIAAGAPAGEADVEFDISWDASWHASWVESGSWTNWDAAWVFVKYREEAATRWSHATLSTNDGDHTAPVGSTIDVGLTGSVGMGVFLYRSAEGFGSWTNTGVKLRWLYSDDGVADSSEVDISVHAIEMVHVPSGSFVLGDGTGAATFYEHPTAGNSYTVMTENAISVGATAGYLNYATGGFTGDGLGPIPAAFPKGYEASYWMKYELSQGQYAEFLNQLSSGDATTRYPNKNGSNRHTISGTHPNYSASAPDRACNWLNWADGVAYGDWSGLRPMTELEYEKACRGPLSADAGEYAWGNTTIDKITAFTGVDGSGTETPSVASDNANFDGAFTGPVRCGIFARATSDRTTSGSTYWGIMEMSGNVWERLVTAASPEGRVFTGLHGDGELSAGAANVANWPAANGAGSRGGNYGTTTAQGWLRVSDRSFSDNDFSSRSSTIGWRVGRTDP